MARRTVQMPADNASARPFVCFFSFSLQIKLPLSSRQGAIFRPCNQDENIVRFKTTFLSFYFLNATYCGRFASCVVLSKSGLPVTHYVSIREVLGSKLAEFSLDFFNLLKPSGYYMHMLEHCVCVFHMVLTINSDCFPKQH
jgi:hypothetical protein